MELPFGPFEVLYPAAVVGLLVLPVLWIYTRRTLVRFSRWQVAAALVCRAAIVIMAVLALSGTTLLKPTTQQYVVFVTDRSASVEQASQQEADSFIHEAMKHQGDNQVAIMSFADGPGELIVTLAAEDNESSKLFDTNGSNLARAVEFAAGQIPFGFVPQVVLLSDGNETDGDVLEAAKRLHVPIHTVPLDSYRAPEVYIAEVLAPAQARENTPLDLEVIVQANESNAGTLELVQGENKLDAQQVKVKAGENRFRFRQPLNANESLQFITLRVRLSGFKDTNQENNERSVVVYNSGKPKVLLVEPPSEMAGPLKSTLERAGTEVTRVRPDALQNALDQIQRYDLVVLASVPTAQITAKQQEQLREYVQTFGGGLMVLGGKDTFEKKSFQNTVMEAILPVRSQVATPKPEPVAAFLLVIDNSKSMEIGNRIGMARDAAVAALGVFKSKDKFGVLAFNDNTQWISEIRPVAERRALIVAIRALRATGGTNMYPAMEKGFLALRQVEADKKTMFILTDGLSTPENFRKIVREMVAEGITVSTVSVGEGVPPAVLKDIAIIGKGRYQHADDPNRLPKIFEEEFKKGGVTQQSIPFKVLLVSEVPGLANLDLDKAPTMAGSVETTLKENAQLILATGATRTSEGGDPLLAWWRYGKGMTAVFTSDAPSRADAKWLTWTNYKKFWTALVRQTTRQTATDRVRLAVKNRGSRATVHLELTDLEGQFVNGAPVMIEDEAGKEPIVQTGPGRYTAVLNTSLRARHLQIRFSTFDQKEQLAHQGVVAGYPEELKFQTTNESLLQEISKASGGTYEIKPEDVFTPRTAMKPTELWPCLLLIAAFVFVLDVALRRIDIAQLLGRPAPRQMRKADANS